MQIININHFISNNHNNSPLIFINVIGRFNNKNNPLILFYLFFIC